MVRSYLNDFFFQSRVKSDFSRSGHLRFEVSTSFHLPNGHHIFFCWKITPIPICKTNPNPKTNPKTDPNPKKTLTLGKKRGRCHFGRWN